MPNPLAQDSDTSLGLPRETAIGVIRFVAAAADSVPIAGQVASNLLGLVETVEGMRSNKEGFKDIIRKASEILSFLGRRRPTVEETSFTLGYIEAMQTFADIVAEICTFAAGCRNRKWWIRLIRLRADADKVSQYGKRLDDALSLFKLELLHAQYLVSLEMLRAYTAH
ncbi:hypothetical protein BDN72DRAFT_960015 [Pluteus cervinus]|uniref:Uncharacterized protein n=1 Tax=Pluteus cervinus TaxID=181527 RepID=A0ACD3AS53_9AGAR|nr:hypothetical protein BDN72DRAFT_960015 [Pluteus cervinus]